jgi:cell division protein ZapD
MRFTSAFSASPPSRRIDAMPFSPRTFQDSRFTVDLPLAQNTVMNSNPDTAAEAAPAPVVYEQPLNERMRNFLRLEFLYTQAIYHSELANPWSTRAAVASLLELLAITARGDARSDVLKELERQMSVLQAYQRVGGVDPNRLNLLVSNLLQLRNDLSNAGGNFMAPLRESEFLSAIKHRSAIPGGTCDFDLPDYSYWLNRPPEVRAAEFDAWLALLRPLCDSVAELLWIVRQNGRIRQETAVGGIFQLQFDRETSCQLVRISLAADSALFPEVSGNQHRCTVRFLNWTDPNRRPAHVEFDVPFQLTRCT